MSVFINALGRIILADQQFAIGEVLVRGDFQVKRGGYIFVDTACKIKKRAMARTKKSTLPV
jgi:hypothetical protein